MAPAQRWQVVSNFQTHSQVVRSSCLYETSAAYVTDQPSFLNAAVLARTHLSPRDLLHHLKVIEEQAGRDLQVPPCKGLSPLASVPGAQSLVLGHICLPDCLLKAYHDVLPNHMSASHIAIAHSFITWHQSTPATNQHFYRVPDHDVQLSL